MSELILSSLFDEQPAPKKGYEDRALEIWERMAATLERIAANTKIDAAQRTRNSNKAVNGVLIPPSAQSSTEEARHTPKPQVASASSTSLSGPDRSLLQSVAKEVGQSVAKNVQTALATQGKKSSVRRERAANGRFSSTATKAPDTTKAQETARENRRAKAEEKRNDELKDSLKGVFSMKGALKWGTEKATEQSDAKDAAGYGVGGVYYGVAKELAQVVPDSMKNAIGEKWDSVLARKPDEKTPEQHDKPQNGMAETAEARKQEQHLEVAEENLALDRQEAKAEKKRHKELVRAVKANKRDMMDRLLDRMAFRGGGLPFGGRGGGRAGAGGRLGNGGILGNAGRAGRAGRAGGGILARTGGALAGGAKLLGRAFPLLAAGMAVYDGFQGWNNKDLHKEAFGLKDGQEATTGQKASSAIASVLDLGGLTTGLLGMLGLDVNTADIARNIYAFGQTFADLAVSVKDTVMNLLPGLWDGIKDISSKAWEGAKQLGESVANFASEMADKATALIPEIIAGIGSIGQKALDGALSLAEKIGGFAVQLVDGAAALIPEIVSNIGSIGQKALDAAMELAGTIGNFARRVVEEGGAVLAGLWEGIKDLPGKIINGAVNWAKEAVSGAGDFFGSLFGGSEVQAAELTPKNAEEYSRNDVAKEAAPQTAPIVPDGIDNVLPSRKVHYESEKQQTGDFTSDTSSTTREGYLPSSAEHANQEAIKRQSEAFEKGFENLARSIEKQTKILDDMNNFFQGKNDFTSDVTGERIKTGLEGALERMARMFNGGMGGGGSSSGGGSGGYGGSTAYQYKADAKIGDTIAQFESGDGGVKTVAYDRTGGTSYGKWQLSSKAGSMEDWLKDLEAAGGEQAAIAQRIRAAGPLNTGSKSGAAVDQYLKEVAANPELIEETQRQSLLKHNYNVTMNSLNKSGHGDLVKMISDDKSLQEMLFSTSVQHGGGGAADIMRKVYRQGMSKEDLIKAVYAERGKHFGSSSAAVQTSVNSRFGREAGLILGMDAGIAQAQKIKDTLAQGGNAAAGTAMSNIVAGSTEEAMQKNVAYKLGAKNMASGQIDCSGWVQKVGNEYMKGINAQAGKEVFSKDAIYAFNKGANEEGAAGIIEAVSKRTGELLQDEQLSPQNIREGMVLGVAKNGDDRVSGRFKGIGHIVQTYRDPSTGKIMVSQSTSETKGGDGRTGVKSMTYEEWWANEQHKGNRHIYGADMTKMANADMLPPTQPTAIAKDATQQTDEASRNITENNRQTHAATMPLDSSAKLSAIERGAAISAQRTREPVARTSAVTQNAAAMAQPRPRNDSPESVAKINQSQSNDKNTALLEQVVRGLNRLIATSEQGNKIAKDNGKKDDNGGGTPTIGDGFENQAANSFAAA